MLYWLDSLIGRGALLSVVSYLFAVPETKLLTCGYTIAYLLANMGTPAVVIGSQYCGPSTSQYTLSKAQKRSKNWSVVDAANGSVIFTLVRFNTNSNGWFSHYETQLVDAQGNIVARIQDKVMYLLLCLQGSAMIKLYKRSADDVYTSSVMIISP
jgi:hypothetical protein